MEIKTSMSFKSFPSVELPSCNRFNSLSSLSTFSFMNFSAMYFPTYSLLAGSVPENSTEIGDPLTSTFSLSPTNLTLILYLSLSFGVNFTSYVPFCKSVILIGSIDFVISFSETTVTSKVSLPLKRFSFSSFLARILNDVSTFGVPPKQAGPKKIVLLASVS